MAGVAVLWVVAAALVADDGRVLVQQRPAGKSLAGLWEFPGGKIEQGESPEGALVRELREELGIEVAAGDLVPGTFASATLDARHLVMLVYVCRTWRGEPTALEAAAIAWHTPDELRSLPMPPADIPLIDWLEQL